MTGGRGMGLYLYIELVSLEGSIRRTFIYDYMLIYKCYVHVDITC